MLQQPTEHIKTISEFHRLRGLSQPEHPLISVVNYADIQRPPDIGEKNLVFDFYQISIKRGLNAQMKYGQQQYDFQDGVAFFASPNQVFRIIPRSGSTEKRSGWMLLIHPDFLWSTSLSKTIKRYEFFEYSVNEALFLSEKEEKTMNGIIENIRQEFQTNKDQFSKQIIVNQIESLLSYAQRFYNRQFITREKSSHELLDRLEQWLSAYFSREDLITKGLPTVQQIADTLNTSPKYLSSMLKVLTGQNTQQHIHNHLIEKAKEQLSITSFSVSEIAYRLGFEHPQSFSKLFKSKTGVSPVEFRRSIKKNYPLP